MPNKFLDEQGLKYLWEKISLQDYPNNQTLISVISAIDQTKADKADIPLVDTTLSVPGAAADARIVGAALAATRGEYVIKLDLSLIDTDIAIPDFNHDDLWDAIAAHKPVFCDLIYSDVNAENFENPSTSILKRAMLENMILGDNNATHGIRYQLTSCTRDMNCTFARVTPTGMGFLFINSEGKAMSQFQDFPTLLSEFTNDVGYITNTDLNNALRQKTLVQINTWEDDD